jgi:glycerol uptake facilitator protein
LAVSEPGVAAAPGGPAGEPAVVIPERGPAAFVAEFIGTASLVFFITMVITLFISPPTPQGQGLPPVQPFIDWSVIGLVHVFVLFLLIQTLAVICGAHFNPAITAGMAAIRQIRPIDAAIYVLCQLGGGVVGALLTKALLSDEGRALHYGAVSTGGGRLDPHTTWLGFVAEALGAFFLMWAVVGVAVSPRGLRDWSGFVIGATLGGVVMIIGPLTGAGINPARAFGPALVGHHFGGFGHFVVVYVLGPVVGALIAAVGYFYLFILPGKKGAAGLEPVG